MTAEIVSIYSAAQSRRRQLLEAARDILTDVLDGREDEVTGVFRVVSRLSLIAADQANELRRRPQ